MKKSRNSGKFIKRFIQAGIVAALVLACFLLVRQNTMAFFKASNAMRYSRYSSEHTIEDSTLFIGTYLINMNAMTDELYEKAMTSASESNQTVMYYKSELADGSWFSVSNAEGLTDIMDTGEIVSESELADLYVQYVVGSDGSMTDVMTGKNVNPFNVPDPYDLSKLPELNPLWMQYNSSSEAEEITEDDYLKNKNSENSGNLRRDVYTYRLLTTFFSLDLRDDVTDGYDADLARLFACYRALKDSGQDEEADLVYSLMAKVDAARREIIMDKLSTMDGNLLDVLYELANGKYYTTFGNFLDSDSEDDISGEPSYVRELRDALSHDFTEGDGSSSWWQPLQQTYDDYNQYASTESSESESDSSSEKKEDQKYKVPRSPFTPDESLLSAIGDSTESCQQSYNTYLSKALSDVDSVLGHAEYEYSRQVIDEASASGAGGPINYLRDIVNIKESNIKHAESEKDLLDSALLGLAEGRYEGAATAGVSEEYTSAMRTGSGTAAADTVLNEELGDTEAKRTELEFLIDAYKQRETAATALSYVEGCISWTEGLYGAVPDDEFKAKADGSIDSHMKWLRELRQQIIDSDASLRSKLDELNDRKNELQKKRDAALDDNDLAGARDIDAQISAVDQDIAAEEGKTGKKSSDKLADEVLDDALAALAENPDADVSNAKDALEGMGDDDALNKLNDRTGDGDDSSGSGSSKGSGALDEDGILDILRNLFGKDIDSMTDGELAIVTAAVSRFSRTGNSAATSLAGDFADKLRARNSKYLYNQYSSKTPEYISLKTIGDCTAYRYFYDDTKRTATMTQGSKAFIFQNGVKTVNRANKDEDLKYKTEIQRYPYISEDDAEALFDCYAEYVVQTGYSVCLTGSMEGRAKEVLSALEEG